MLPTYVFIVPYRDREYQKAVFLSHMKEILKGDSYEITFVHQKDKREFNRGAMKNIGFIHYKKTYPNDWKDITFIFHDIDNIPYKKIFDYDTTKGTVTHFYGFKFALERGCSPLLYVVSLTVEKELSKLSIFLELLLIYKFLSFRCDLRITTLTITPYFITIIKS